jgi:hypothetical protein
MSNECGMKMSKLMDLYQSRAIENEYPPVIGFKEEDILLMDRQVHNNSTT